MCCAPWRAADHHTFNYLADGGYVFLVVADEEFGRQVPFACLERIKNDFKTTYADRAKDAIAHSLDRSFGPTLKVETSRYRPRRHRHAF